MINRPRIDSETVARVIAGCRATTSSSHKTQSRPLIALWRMRRSSQRSGRDPLWLRSCLVRRAPCDLLSKASLIEVLDNLSMLIECEPRTRRIEFRWPRPNLEFRAIWSKLWSRSYDVTTTSTHMPRKASVIPTKLPDTGIACRMSRATATGTKLKPPTPRLVGSKVIQPAPGTKTSAQAWVDPAPLTLF